MKNRRSVVPSRHDSSTSVLHYQHLSSQSASVLRRKPGLPTGVKPVISIRSIGIGCYSWEELLDFFPWARLSSNQGDSINPSRKNLIGEVMGDAMTWLGRRNHTQIKDLTVLIIVQMWKQWFKAPHHRRESRCGNGPMNYTLGRDDLADRWSKLPNPHLKLSIKEFDNKNLTLVGKC